MYDIIKKYVLDSENLDTKVKRINELKILLHEISPFKDEPVDCVLWVSSDTVGANDYNPNTVAPPEMELLRHSIGNDGYTQPVVTWGNDESREVVDGFHRTRVVKECEDVRTRVHGYLPVVTIKDENTDRNNRIASTIRHNRARGKHNVDSMSDIVIELKKRNWSDNRICKELGMDHDEVLRLCQVSGLVEVFGDCEFSKSWETSGITDDDINILDESDIQADKDIPDGRTLHQWQDWECYPAGFYNAHPPKGMDVTDCENIYRMMLSNRKSFQYALNGVTGTWVKSCEHYLTNDKMNRVAWLGQAALCWMYGIPSRFRGGYNLLSDEEKQTADNIALNHLNKWLVEHGNNAVSMEEAGVSAHCNLY